MRPSRSPCAFGSERYAGTHAFKPHHPKSVQAFITVTAAVTAPRRPRKMSENRAVVVLCFHMSGSSTFRRTHSVKRAGRTPTKNTTRQPHVGRTRAVTSAAAPLPIAHELCMNPSALPRVSAGHVSDTSAAPLAHSPPMPNPSSTRKMASCHMFCASPHRPVKIEYSRTLPMSARVRPRRSAITPNTSPPAAPPRSVIDPSRPACGFVRPRSAMSAASTNEKSMTSNASSIHPKAAATSARWARSSAARHQPRRPAGMGD